MLSSVKTVHTRDEPYPNPRLVVIGSEQSVKRLHGAGKACMQDGEPVILTSDFFRLL